jgi:hypothetical protein
LFLLELRNLLYCLLSSLRGDANGEITKIFGMPCVAPPMGPWPLEDNLGMKVVMALLD